MANIVNFNQSQEYNIQGKELQEFLKKLEYLEKEWEKSEKKYKGLLKENEKLGNLLEMEKSKTLLYEKRLKFIQDNQKTFEKLRQVYLNVKYNESAKNKMIEIREIGIQTEDLLMTINSNDNLTNITMHNIDSALNMVQGIKNLVQTREINCAINQHKAYEMNKSLMQIKQENSMLKMYLQAKNLELDALKTDEALIDQCIEENKILRKLTQKYDKYLRAAERSFKPVKYPELTDEEKQFISYITDPYQIQLPQNVPANMSQSENVLKKPKRSAYVDSVKQNKEIKTLDSAYRLLEKLRIVQPHTHATSYDSFETANNNLTLNKNKKIFHPCDKLNKAYSHAVMSSSNSCKRTKSYQ